MNMVAYQTLAISPTQSWASGDDGSQMYLFGETPGRFTTLIYIANEGDNVKIVERHLSQRDVGLEFICNENGECFSQPSIQPLDNQQQMEISRMIKKVFNEYFLEKKYQ